MLGKNEKISSYQAFLLVYGNGSAWFFLVTQYIGEDVGRDNWIATLLAYIIGIPLVLIILNLNKIFPKMTIVQYLPKIYGNFIGKTIGMAYILYYLFITAITLKDTAEQIKPLYMETPQLVVMSMMMLAVVLTLKLGFEVFVRVLEYIIPVAVIILALCILFILFNLEFGQIKPFLEEGIGPVLKALPISIQFPLLVIFFMGLWLPYINDNTVNIKVSLYGMVTAGMVMTVINIIVIAFSGIESIINNTFIVYQLFSYIRLGKYVVGFEGFFLLLWLSTTYYLISMTMWIAVVGTAQWLKLKDYKMLILPIAAISIALATVPITEFDNRAIDSILTSFMLYPLGGCMVLGWVIARVKKQHKT